MDSLERSNYNNVNFIKLQDFKKKLFLIGIYDDPLHEMIPEPEDDKEGQLKLFHKTFESGSEMQSAYQSQVVRNIKLIRDTMLKLRPDAMVVEMCEDRNQRWLSDVVAHPNYDATISDINEMLNKDPEKLKEYD